MPWSRHTATGSSQPGHRGEGEKRKDVIYWQENDQVNSVFPSGSCLLARIQYFWGLPCEVPKAPQGPAALPAALLALENLVWGQSQGCPYTELYRGFDTFQSLHSFTSNTSFYTHFFPLLTPYTQPPCPLAADPSAHVAWRHMYSRNES